MKVFERTVKIMKNGFYNSFICRPVLELLVVNIQYNGLENVLNVSENDRTLHFVSNKQSG